MQHTRGARHHSTIGHRYSYLAGLGDLQTIAICYGAWRSSSVHFISCHGPPAHPLTAMIATRTRTWTSLGRHDLGSPPNANTVVGPVTCYLVNRGHRRLSSNATLPFALRAARPRLALLEKSMLPDRWLW